MSKRDDVADDTASDMGETQDDARPVEVRVSQAARILNQRYELIRMIGEGGMGEVNECKDLLMERSVALKTIRRDRQARHLEARFVREACVQAQLEHPSVVPVFEVGRSEKEGDVEGSAFFTMRKVTGITLDEIVEGKRKGDKAIVQKWTRHRLLTVFAQLCLTVHYAHARGVLHRDLKPSNIMLGEFGEVYVLDWGLAKLSPNDREEPATDLKSLPVQIDAGGTGKHQTAHGTALGTPAYMAPEQMAATRELDGRADVFALGAVLFEILTLQTLLDDAAVEARLRAGNPTWDARPSVRAPDEMVPPEFDRICVRATAKEIDKRYASARALHDVIEAYLDGERDQELRSTLAASFLSRALEIKSTNQDEAFRLVNRALALAPDDPRGLELLVDLLKETSGTSSLAARAEVHIEGVERQRQAQPVGVVLFTLPWLTVYPLLAALRGVKSIPIAMIPALAWIVAALANYIDHKRSTQDRVIYPTVCILVAVGLTTIPFGPLFMAPALATIMVANLILVSARVIRVKTVALGCAALIIPTFCGVTGIYETYRFDSETTLVMYSIFREVRPFNLSIVLTMVDVLMVFSTAYFASNVRDEIETARSTNAIFGWQLSKLLPPAISESKRKGGEAATLDSNDSAIGAKKTRRRDSKSELARLLDTEIDAAPLRAVAQTSFTRAVGEQSSDDEASTGGATYPLLSLEGERYVHGELLIEGVSTEVYRVRDRLVGRDVAMKRLRSDLPSPASESLSRSFTREALLQAHVEHPSVPPVYDIGVDDHGPWFTMKLVRGTSLTDVVSHHEAGRHQRLAAFASVCLTIDFAHQHGVVHAALDPSKIVLGEFGEVYVLGWSHAKKTSTTTSIAARTILVENAAHAGSREYTAPEQLTSGDATEQGDIYSLGAILFEVAAGKPPSSGARLPKELDEICAKAMARDPSLRFSSTRALHDAVEAFLSSDRDEALRRSLAAERLERARTNLEAAKTDVAARGEVLRNVGRALALAPDRAPALKLLATLLSSPPTQTPPVVTEEIRLQAWGVSKLVSRWGALSLLFIWLGVFPIYCAVVGVRDGAMAIAIIAAWLVAALTIYTTYRFGKEEPRVPWVAITSAIALGVTSLLFSQYFIVPGLAIALTLAYIFTVGRKWRWLSVTLTCLGLVVPLVLMWTHLSPVLEMPGREEPEATFIIRGAVFHPPLVFVIGLCLTNVFNIIFVGYYSARFRDMLDELEAENRAKVHALSRLI